MMLWTLMGNVIVGSIIYAGVTSGIERAVTVMMPLMFTLLVGLSIYNYFAGGFVETLEWLFTPDFSKVTGATFLAAIGQAFFSIGVGHGGDDDLRSLLASRLFHRAGCGDHRHGRYAHRVASGLCGLSSGISFRS